MAGTRRVGIAGSTGRLGSLALRLAQEADDLHPLGQPVGGGPTDPGPLAQLPEGDRTLACDPQDGHHLVQHADPAMLSHKPILTSHCLGSPDLSTVQILGELR